MGKLHGARHIGGCGGSTGFNVADPLEVRQNGVTAFGVAGFVPPSLLSINYHAPYLHNGKAQTLDAVFPLHRLGTRTIASTLSGPQQ